MATKISSPSTMATPTLTTGKIYHTDEISEVLTEYVIPAKLIKTNKKRMYYNIPCAFDIETTSFYTSEKEKAAIMYEWTLGLNGAVIIGRTWAEFMTVYNVITETLKTYTEKRLVIYIHNAGFEFQFIRCRFQWENVFSIDQRKPIYAVTKEGIEFRCSYLLSGYGLAALGGQLQKYKVEKMSGDLDYHLLRHSLTPLTEKELKYCENDARVVMAYIQERIEADGDISRIPITKTGYVRRYCKNQCLYDGSHKKNPWKWQKYNGLMSALILDVDEYKMLKRAFQGGYVHANAYYSEKILYNVGSFDFTSSYPAVMVAEQFPMSRGERVEIKSKEQFEKNIALYCCLFDVEIINLESITMVEHPLSASRCRNMKKETEDNGRIVCAEHLNTTLTEQDYYILQKFYKWKQFRVGKFIRYKRGYLPTDFVKAILKLYGDKTTLKGVAGSEEQYLRAKEMINSCYGMTVTDICRDEIVYNGDWGENPVDIEKTLEKYNHSKQRFLFYPWGVWVTAYARKNLFTGIYEFGNDYVYSDTDSVKGVNCEKHRKYIEQYNKNIVAKLERALKYHGIDPAAIRPKTIKGVEKVLGVWDDEGIYTRFKTLGAKRYMVEKPNVLKIDDKYYDISITVSGVDKKKAVPYLIEKYGKKIFEHFDDDLYIPPEYTGKNTHTYIDYEQRGVLTDYTGITAEYHEFSSTHLEAADYSLSLSVMYIEYLMGIREYNK